MFKNTTSPVRKTNPSNKVVFAGQTNVGKSSIIYRFNENDLPSMSPTLGVAFNRKSIVCNDEIIALDIWDTAGQERFHSLSSFYFRQCSYCILVFDISNPGTFNDVKNWKRICDDANSGIYNTTGNPLPTYFLVGNKKDKEIHAINQKEILEYCESNNIYDYIETSAITGEGIDILCEKIVNHICDNRIMDIPVNDLVQLEAPTTANPYCSC